MTARRHLPGLVAAALVLHAVATSPHWAQLGAAFSGEGPDYASRREVEGFGGFPIRRAAAVLDAHLAPEVPVRLGPSLFQNDFFRQRISEGLYPRVVSSEATHSLRLAPRERFDPSRDTAVAELGPDGIVYLEGVLPRRPEPAAPREGFALDGLALGLALAAAVGLGGAAGIALRRGFGVEAAFLPPLVIPLAALFVALCASVASWLQVPVGSRACAAIGWALLPVAAALVARDAKLRAGLSAAWPAGRPETWILALFLCAFVAALAILPIAVWDGRSIWLFQAKRLYFDGLLTVQAAADPDAQWSHTSYPLLLPAWMAFATSLSPVYNERLIGLGVGLLFASELWLVWMLACRRLGRASGAALAAALALGLAAPRAQGLADGYLTLLLVAQLLAGLGAAAPALHWMLALAASLTKLEGFVLAFGVAVACALARERPASRRTRLLPWLVFVPAALHVAWARGLGLRGDFDEMRLGGALGELPQRAAIVLGALPGLLAESPLLVEGAAATVLLASVCLAGRRAPTRAEVVALAVATGFAAFAFGTMAVTPKDVEWHVAHALGRLLVHPAAVLVLAALLCASPERGDGRETGGPVQPSSSSA
jgi:tetrahydromethanopterin S-methyltransferase subunit F